MTEYCLLTAPATHKIRPQRSYLSRPQQAVQSTWLWPPCSAELPRLLQGQRTHLPTKAVLFLAPSVRQEQHWNNHLSLSLLLLCLQTYQEHKKTSSHHPSTALLSRHSFHRLSSLQAIHWQKPSTRWVSALSSFQALLLLSWREAKAFIQMISLAMWCVRVAISKEMQYHTTLEGLLQPHHLLEIRFPLEMGKDDPKSLVILLASLLLHAYELRNPMWK